MTCENGTSCTKCKGNNRDPKNDCKCKEGYDDNGTINC